MSLQRHLRLHPRLRLLPHQPVALAGRAEALQAAADAVAARQRPTLTQPPPSRITVAGSTAAVTPSDKPRTALFFIMGHPRMQVKRAAVGAEGFVLDHFSHDAVSHYLQKVGKPLIGAFGSTPPTAIFSDSLEAAGSDWTPNMSAEFLKRRGYDLIPHLPELAAGGSVAADTVRHDYGETLTDLVDENYLTQLTNFAIAHHTKFRSQTYGEPAVDFSSQNIASLAEGESPAVARLLHAALGHLRQPRLQPHRQLRRDLYLAALAGLPRHPAGHEDRGGHRLHHGREPDLLPRLALLAAAGRSAGAGMEPVRRRRRSTTTTRGTR